MIVKFSIRLLILTGIILLISYAALHLNPDYKKEYVAGIIPKLDKLKEVKARKIVIIGGSNASFGIDTGLMERRLGIPVVNMALHGGIPVKYVVEQVKPFMNENDILIFSKEYEGLRDRDWNMINGTEISKVATYDITQIRVLLSDRTLFETTVSNIFNTIKKYIELHPIKGRNGISSVYDARAFEEDNLKAKYITGTYKLQIEQHEIKNIEKSSILLSGLKRYKDYFDNKGVKFYFTPPVVIKGYFEEDQILPFWNFFSEQTGIPWLNDNKKYSFDKKYFFNSHYHPNLTGRRIRTISLIEDIVNAGLVMKNLKTPSENIFVGEKRNISLANLESFNGLHNFEILKRNKNEINIKQRGDLSHNYFRIRFENRDYTGYNFYLRIQCDNEVLSKIKFRGAGQLANFDTVIDYGNNIYGLWKNTDNVLYKNGNSYFGISFPDDEKLMEKELTIENVGVYENFGKDDNLAKHYTITNEQENVLFFKIISKKDMLDLKDIVDSEDRLDDIGLKTNKLYKVVIKKNKILIKDFYKEALVFETSEDFSFESTSIATIMIYE